MNIVIKDYEQQYQDKIIEIITEIQQQEFGLKITAADQPDLESINDFYDAFLVALFEGNPVGTIGYKRIDDYAMIRKMFVQTEFRGRVYGTAQKLIEAIETKIGLANLNRIYLGTTELFKAAHKFYERNNYLEIPKENLPVSFPVMKVDTKFYTKNIVQ